MNEQTLALDSRRGSTAVMMMLLLETCMQSVSAVTTLLSLRLFWPAGLLEYDNLAYT
jgi:hypothetical protein